ncbi:hypothetical protein M413DRAFT_440049 [Hebeloma cylindrosporum]|uniref:Uracil-DNA glycosylase n=1 Tax=Hebeloma cylindrosporum TaxID=76867 RepID=A0A0C2YEW6_HEBCY|nr:hypothetical protein M413DRAFT_440049 [Hebeloma cylindrosporum h7]
MPKVTADSEQAEEMLGEVVATTSRMVSRSTARVAAGGTLTDMWTKKSSTTTRTKVAKKAAVEVEVNRSETVVVSASSSSAQAQTNAVTEAMLATLEDDTMEESWRKQLQPEFKKSYFTSLKKFLLAQMTTHTVYPAVNNIYSWSRFTPLNEVKVVILGQDPYHDAGQAHGLSFSVLPPTKPPGSLKNIYKQLEADFPGFKASISNGDLSPVAKQGVLWLNTSLTVQAHKAGSHARKGWETFTTQVIRAVLQRKREDGKVGVVFMAWGLPAQKTFSSIGIDEKKHLLLKSAHPSPLSAHRGFLGNGHFKKANEWLSMKYGKGAEIDWTVLAAK